MWYLICIDAVKSELILTGSKKAIITLPAATSAEAIVKALDKYGCSLPALVIVAEDANSAPFVKQFVAPDVKS